MIDTGFSQPRAVVFEGARIFVEIFPGAELQAIDEDAGDDHVGVLAGLAHQRDVAVVKVAHGGREGDAGGLEARIGEGRTQAGDGRMDLHGGFQ